MIICIGDGGSASDIAAQEIAQARNLNYYGVLDANTKLENGVYHTSDVDITAHELLNIVDEDTEIVELANADQKLLSAGQQFDIKHMLETNDSFCTLGWTSLLQDHNRYRFCCFQTSPVTVTDDFDYSTNTDIAQAKQNMLEGKPVPQCEYCVHAEQSGRRPVRKIMSHELATLTGASSVNEITNLLPVDYDVRIGNQCNAQCRMCCSEDSRLIDIEYTKLGLQDRELGNIPSTSFDIIDIDTAKRVYVAGGEPAISIEFARFLQLCIDHNRTDIVIKINTNAYILPERFLNLIEQFDNVEFIISVDGFEDLLYYIRYPITWDKLVKNIDTLSQYGTMCFNHSIQIYNVVGMYDLFKYFDIHYTDHRSMVCYVDSPEKFWFGNYPDKNAALEEIVKCKTLDRYTRDNEFKQDILHIENTIRDTELDVNMLQEFFNFNDLLDHSRGVYLKDYLPILDAQRKVV